MDTDTKIQHSEYMNSLHDKYPPNNRNYTKPGEQRKVVSKEARTAIVSGKVNARADTVLGRLSRWSVGDDAKDMGTYILQDIVIPNIKGLFLDSAAHILDMAKDCVEGILFGSVTPSNRRPTNGGRTNYNARSNYRSRASMVADKQIGDKYEVDEVIVDTAEHAEEVISTMIDIIETDGSVTVAQFKNLVKLPDDNFMDNEYGWTNLNGARTSRVRDGYLIRLPRAKYIIL